MKEVIYPRFELNVHSSRDSKEITHSVVMDSRESVFSEYEYENCRVVPYDIPGRVQSGRRLVQQIDERSTVEEEPNSPTMLLELSGNLPVTEFDEGNDAYRSSCVHSGQHNIHRVKRKGDIHLVQTELKRIGKNGSFVVTTLANHPVYPLIMHVLLQDSVYYYPIARAEHGKLSLEPHGKQFNCLCKLVAHYRRTHLPSVKLNLTSQMVPALPVCDMESEYDEDQ
ncbi:hypothetical protein ScPMuIL_012634 [Solemya velum]